MEVPLLALVLCFFLVLFLADFVEDEAWEDGGELRRLSASGGGDDDSSCVLRDEDDDPVVSLLRFLSSLRVIVGDKESL